MIFKSIGEKALQKSGLEWTIIRPGGLNEEENDEEENNSEKNDELEEKDIQDLLINIEKKVRLMRKRFWKPDQEGLDPYL